MFVHVHPLHQQRKKRKKASSATEMMDDIHSIDPVNVAFIASQHQNTTLFPIHFSPPRLRGGSQLPKTTEEKQTEMGKVQIVCLFLGIYLPTCPNERRFIPRYKVWLATGYHVKDHRRSLLFCSSTIGICLPQVPIQGTERCILVYILYSTNKKVRNLAVICRKYRPFFRCLVSGYLAITCPVVQIIRQVPRYLGRQGTLVILTPAYLGKKSSFVSLVCLHAPGQADRFGFNSVLLLQKRTQNHHHRQLGVVQVDDKSLSFQIVKLPCRHRWVRQIGTVVGKCQ